MYLIGRTRNSSHHNMNHYVKMELIMKLVRKVANKKRIACIDAD